MYTKRELQAATKIIGKIARMNHTSKEQVRMEMERAMNIGRSSFDPVIRARWATFRYAGSKPTAEEFILWTAGIVKVRRDFTQQRGS